MRWKEDNGLKWLEFEIFSECPNLVHAVFARQGGSSLPPFDALNLGDGIGDREQLVTANRQRICQQLQLDHLVRTTQVHGTQLTDVTRESPELLPDCDGFVLAEPGVGAMVKHGDCQATIFYDPTRHVAANIHAGWRGLVGEIYAATVERLQQQYQCKPEDLLVAVAPSLGPEAAEFVNYREDFPEYFWEHQLNPCHFDLWDIAELQLTRLGILSDHIEITRVSTFSHPENFFSYRRERRTGRHGTVVALV